MKISIKAGDSLRVTESKNYWFGDPCYIFDNDNPVHSRVWSEFVDQMYVNGAETELSAAGIAIMTINDKEYEFLYQRTMYGDGSYSARSGYVSKDCGVDAGMLAIIPVDLIEAMYPEEQNYIVTDILENMGMHIPDFMGNVTIENCNWYGAVECVTDESDIEDEEDFDDEWDRDEDDREEDF